MPFSILWTAPDGNQRITALSPKIVDLVDVQGIAAALLADAVVEAGSTFEVVDALPDGYLLAQARQAAPIRLKAAARLVILARMPDWKQANMTARAVELSSLPHPTAAETAEKAAIHTAWDWVKAVRAKSDQLEAQAATAASREAIEAIITGAAWPDWPGGA